MGTIPYKRTDAAAKIFFSNYKYIPVTISLILLTVFYYSITYNDFVVGYLSDDAIYLFLAELYSPWFDDYLPVHELLRLENRFPPLYPLILGLLGVTTKTPALASYISNTFLLLTFALFLHWSWKITNNYYLSLSISLLFALFPSTIIMSQGLWSEFLFMTLIYGLFILFEKNEKSNKIWLLSALIIAMATLTRSIGIIISVPFYLFLIKNRPNNYRLLIVICILPFILWSLIHYTSTSNPGYWNDFNVPGRTFDLTIIFNYLVNKSSKLWLSYIWLFSPTQFITDHAIVYHILFLILFSFFLLGLYTRIKQKKIDAYTFIIYLATLIVWPYSEFFHTTRFLYPLLPLFLLYIWLGIYNFLKRCPVNYLLSLYVFIMVIIIFPHTMDYIKRAYTDIDPNLNPYRRSRAWLQAGSFIEGKKQIMIHKSIADILPQLNGYITENECIYATHPLLTMLYTKRIIHEYPTPGIIDHDELDKSLLHCYYILAMPITDTKGSFPPYYPLSYIHNLKKYSVHTFTSDYNIDIILLKLNYTH